MRVTKDRKPLAPYHLRDHAGADANPHWEGEARQLLSWAADCMEAADRVIEFHAPRPEKETRARLPTLGPPDSHSPWCATITSSQACDCGYVNAHR